METKNILKKKKILDSLGRNLLWGEYRNLKYHNICFLSPSLIKVLQKIEFKKKTELYLYILNDLYASGIKFIEYKGGMYNEKNHRYTVIEITDEEALS